MNNSVIIYRSQSEANSDWFLNNIAFPWIYEHSYVIIGIIIAITIAGYILKRKA